MADPGEIRRVYEVRRSGTEVLARAPKAAAIWQYPPFSHSPHVVAHGSCHL